MTRLPARRRRALTTAIGYTVVCLIWGTNWVAIKIAVTDMPPMLASGLRFLVAAPVLILVCRLKGEPVRFRRDQLGFASFVTLGYFTVPYFLLNLAERHISSGMTAICFSTIAVLIVVLSVPVLGARIGRGQVAGVLTAFGALFVLLIRSPDVTASSWYAVAAALSAAGMHALSYVLIKKHGAQIHTLTLNSLPVAAAGVLLTATSLLVEHPSSSAFTASSVLATVHLALVASVVGLVVYFSLLQRLSALTMSFVFVIFPLLAQVLSQVSGGAGLSPTESVLILIIVLAMAWTLRLQHPADPRPAPWRPTAGQLAAIYTDATRRYPEEACGYVRSQEVRVCANALTLGKHPSSDRVATTGYALTSADLLGLDLTFDSADPARMIYHSHPDVGAYFSEEDHRYAVLDGAPVFPVLQLVVDVCAAGVRSARLFEFEQTSGRYREIEHYREVPG